jgi:hypothetical protein
MTRLELLKLVIGQARTNGFAFKRWYVVWLGLPWKGAVAAAGELSANRRYYSLLFSHEFAESFWKSRQIMTIEVPMQTFQRVLPDGSVGTVTRKGFTRRMTREDAWRYHLSRMAIAEDPLRYIRRFLRVKEELEPETIPPEAESEAMQDPRFIIDEEDLLEEEED